MNYRNCAIYLAIACFPSGCAHQAWTGFQPKLGLDSDAAAPVASTPSQAAKVAYEQQSADLARSGDRGELDQALDLIRTDPGTTPEVARLAEQMAAALQQAAHESATETLDRQLAQKASEPAAVASLQSPERESMAALARPSGDDSTAAAVERPAIAQRPQASAASPESAVATTPAPSPAPLQTQASRQPDLAQRPMTAGPITATAGTPATAANTSVVQASLEIPADERASSTSEPSKEWRTLLSEMITALESAAAEEEDTAEAARLDSFLRMAYLLADRRDEAVDPISSIREDDREFFQHLTYALMIWLDADERHVSSRKAALALREIREAANYLANQSTLDVRNLSLCREVFSYGDYKEFSPPTFEPGAEVIMYVEIENFASTPLGSRHQTEFQCDYQIFDEHGRVVISQVLEADKQTCDNRRRDYFIAYQIFLPPDVAPGSYSLVLTVLDVIGKKSNQARVEFKIR